MKKNLTKKLMLSVLTLAFAVVSLGASTFAWFTVSKEAEVETFKMDVTADAGIQIAVSAVDGSAKSDYYINTLPATEITKVFTAKQFTKFLDLTSYKAGTAAVGNEGDEGYVPAVAAKAEFEGTLYDKTGVAKVEKDGYVALRFYITADAAGTITVTVPWLAQTATSTKVAWAAGSEFMRGAETIAAADKYLYDVLSAARMSVCYDGTYTTYQEVESAKGAVNGEFGNTLGYAAEDQGSLAIYNSFYANDALAQLDAPTEADTATGIAKDGSHVFTIDAARNTEYFFDLYIWVEGFDAECVNAIFAQQIQASVSFDFAQTNA